jgi:hypothetical protein
MEYYSRLDALLDALKSQKLLNKLALGVERIILDRTRKGMDVDGQSFTNYSEPYKKKRAAAQLNTYPVDLFFDHTSGMLTKVDHVINANMESVRVLINDPEKEKIGGYHNTSGAGKSKVIRKWWGIKSSEELEKLRTLAIDTVKMIIKNF